MQTSDLNVNNSESDHANAIFRQFQDAIFSKEHTYVKTLTKIIFDLSQWQEIATLSLPKTAAISLLSSQQHFAGIFASEPMTLPEIDHVSFLVEPVKEDPCKRIQHCCAKLWRSRNKRNVGSCWLKSLTGFKLCATTRNNIQQHATGCANGRTM